MNNTNKFFISYVSFKELNLINFIFKNESINDFIKQYT